MTYDVTALHLHCTSGQGQRSKITDLLYLYDCQLGLGLVTLILTSVVNPDPNPKRKCRFQVNLGDTVNKRRSPG